MVCHYEYIDALQLGHDFYQIVAIADHFGTWVAQQGYQLQFIEAG